MGEIRDDLLGISIFETGSGPYLDNKTKEQIEAIRKERKLINERIEKGMETPDFYKRRLKTLQEKFDKLFKINKKGGSVSKYSKGGGVRSAKYKILCLLNQKNKKSFSLLINKI